MRILFDQGTPAPLRFELSGHVVATAYEMGWANLSNGELLKAAQPQFDILITTDQSLRYQQNLTTTQLAILILPTTSWPTIRTRATEIAVAASAMTPGEIRELQFPDQV